MLRTLTAFPRGFFIAPRFRRAFPFRSRGVERYFLPGQGYSGYGVPNRIPHAEALRPPKFLGNPLMRMPCSSTAVDLGTRPFFGPSSSAFRSLDGVGFHNSLFEAQSHGLRTPCLRFAASVSRRLAQNSVPAAGLLCRAGVSTCWVPLHGFTYFVLGSSLSRFSLAHPKLSNFGRYRTNSPTNWKINWCKAGWEIFQNLKAYAVFKFIPKCCALKCARRALL